MTEPAPPPREARAAATVVPLRDGPAGIEVLLAHRRAGNSFGGYWVFPGGRVEDADLEPGAPSDELSAARRAAVREAREEVGLRIEVAALVTFSHWVPPPQAPVRYATWFFLAGIDASNGDIVVDANEILDHAWVRPADAIARRDAGELDMAPPTWVTLWRVGQAHDAADALARAAARKPDRYRTRSAKTADGMVLLQPGDAGYDTTDPDVPGPRHRFHMREGAWSYEPPPVDHADLRRDTP